MGIGINIGIGIGSGKGGAAAPVPTYEEYISSLSPLLWLRKQETSGTDADNAGSEGATLDGTISGAVTLGQVGQLGANEAFSFDGATGKISVLADASINALQAATYGFLVNWAGLGGDASGRLFDAGTLDIALRLFNRKVQATFGNATSTSTDTFADSVWQWVFVTYDYAGDKKVRIYKGLSGSLAEVAYDTQTAGTGTKGANATAKNIANNVSNVRGFDGLFDETFIIPSVLSTAQMEQIVDLTF